LKSYLERSGTVYTPEGSGTLAGAHCMVIPVYDENDSIYQTLASVKAALQRSPEPVKVLLVINEPANAPENARQNNRRLLESLKKNDGKYDGGLSVNDELLFIDLTDKDIPIKYRNVGNARKAGFDTALAQSDGKVTDKKRLFFSLDADTTVAPDYFAGAFEWIKSNPDAAGAVFHFEHRFAGSDPRLDLAAMKYEIYLRDYACKLRSCGSAYGFWTIGSAFMCNAADYMRCGGMRRNNAGEDFYFLQALRKTGSIGTVPGTTVYPAGRLSERVPFGTGPAIARQLTGIEQKLYHPAIFDLLQKFFQAAAAADAAELRGGIVQFAPAKLQEFFQTVSFAGVWQKIVKNTPGRADALQRALHTYCDGFFVLKFAHYLEETHPDEFPRQVLPSAEKIPEMLQQMRKRDRQQC